MDFLKTLALGCALGGALCSGAQAELIDSVKLANQAYLISESHLYRYDGATGAVLSTIALEQEPVALAASDSALFIAYSSKVEKRDLTGAIVADVSGGDVTRNLPDIRDVAISGDNVYVLFFSGEYVHELKVDDLSPESGPDAPYYTLSTSMQKLVAYSDGGTAFFSPIGTSLGRLDWPPTLDVAGNAPVAESAPQPDNGSYLVPAKELFIMDGPADPQILMDNGSGWTLGGTHTVGWIDGKDFLFADQAEDGEWSVIRNGYRTCESGDALNWATDLVNYSVNAEFISRAKAGEAGGAFNVMHLWGNGDPAAHLFREASPGVLDIEIYHRSEGQPFDDGKPEFTVAVDESLSDYQLQFGVNAQHIALNDDKTRAYVLHQGNAVCQSAIRVYDLENQIWVDSFPLRWKADSIAMVGGTNTDSSDDQLAVAYRSGFDSYGYTHIVVSYVDINAADPVEDPAKDFLEFSVAHTSLSKVEATRHAVLFQVSYDSGSLITAWAPGGFKDSYFSGSRTFSSWASLAAPGEQARLLTRDDTGLVEILNLTEAVDNFTFDAPFEDHDLNDSVKNSTGPLWVSPNMEWFTQELNGFTALFRFGSPAMAGGMPSDFMPVSSQVATWSATAQGDAGQNAFYTVSGGDVEGLTAAEVKRWVMSLGSDDHFEVDATESANIPGLPVLVKVLDAATDDLLLATVYQDQILFTQVNKTLSDAPDFEPGDGGEGDTGGGGDSGSGTGDTGGAASGSGFSSGGGGGGSVAWLFPLALLIAGRLRQVNVK